MPFEREPERRQLLADEVVHVARNPRALVFLRGDQPPHQARDPSLASRPLLDLQLEALRLAHALLELGAGALQRNLVGAADGEVARDLGEAAVLGAAERRRHSAAEQQRAVLSHVPALVLGAALRLRARELLLGHAPVAIFRA